MDYIKTKRFLAFSCNENGFQLGHEFKPGDLVTLAYQPGYQGKQPEVPAGVQTIARADMMRMMHIDERTDKAAVGWCFTLKGIEP